MLKIEKGKTYRLIDKAGYLNAALVNKRMYNEIFENGCVTIDDVDCIGSGFAQDEVVIARSEAKFFEKLASETERQPKLARELLTILAEIDDAIGSLSRLQVKVRHAYKSLGD